MARRDPISLLKQIDKLLKGYEVELELQSNDEMLMFNTQAQLDMARRYLGFIKDVVAPLGWVEGKGQNWTNNEVCSPQLPDKRQSDR